MRRILDKVSPQEIFRADGRSGDGYHRWLCLVTILRLPDNLRPMELADSWLCEQGFVRLDVESTRHKAAGPQPGPHGRCRQGFHAAHDTGERVNWMTNFVGAGRGAANSHEVALDGF